MRFRIALILFLTGWQVSMAQVKHSPKLIAVTTNKTTSLVFPSAISTIDRGSEKIIVQKATATVLRVKADSAFADTTNLTVITTEGRLYSFLVCYAASPKELTIDLGAAGNVNQDTLLLSFSKKIARSYNQLHGIRYGSGKVSLTLLGIYTNGEIIGCKVRIENASPLSFEIGRTAAIITSAHRGKRRPSQEREVPILLIDIATVLIRPRQAGVANIILPKSGLSPGQSLQLQLQERAGERSLLLSVSNRFILNAQLIL